MYVFDLDGTLAPFGKSVGTKVADVLNTLGHVLIISGNSKKRMKAATKLVRNKTLISVGDFPSNFKLDLAGCFGVSKDVFGKSKKYQRIRNNLCLQLRKLDERIYIGGRSTIDFMAEDKSMITNIDWNKVVYFYDNEWSMNNKIHNDVPVIRKAKKSIRTNHIRIIRDIKNVQNG